MENARNWMQNFSDQNNQKLKIDRGMYEAYGEDPYKPIIEEIRSSVEPPSQVIRFRRFNPLQVPND